MITIQAHHRAIGSFFVKAQFLSTKGISNIFFYDKKKCESRARKGGFIKKFGHLNLKMILVIMCVKRLIQATVSGK